MIYKTKKSADKYKLFLFPLIAVLLVALDQVTKYLAVRNLKNKQNITFIDNVIDFSYLENSGAAWGMMSGKITMFVVLTVIIMCLLVFWIYRIQVSLAEKKGKIALILQLDLVVLIAGAVGNLIDRIMNGYVVDFIAIAFIDFPVFNVADCYVTVAVFLLIVILLIGVKEDDLDEILKFNIKKTKGEK